MLKHLQNRILEPFKPLSFDEKKHIYYWYGKRVAKSVSAKVDEHVTKFDADEKIGRNGETLIELSARKHSRLQNREVTIHELRHNWQTAAKEGCELGTETHDYMEYYDGIKPANTPQKKAGVKFLKWLFSQTYINQKGEIERRYEIVCKELRMYTILFGFAGTADLIIADKLPRTIIIGDWKTNKDLFKTFRYLKEPFDYLECHPFNKYGFQLSYYQIMFEEMTGLKVTDRWLIHLKADETYIKYDLYDYSNDLKQYLISSKRN